MEMPVIEMPDIEVHPDNAIVWRDNRLFLLDQRVLPRESHFIHCEDVAETAAAIRDMVVRGAPAIGITAAYGVVLSTRARFAGQGADWQQGLAEDLDLLAASRPTAVNLFWAIERMRDCAMGLPASVNPTPAILAEALRIHQEDIAANHRMGELGATLIETPTAVITHCNAGALATGGYGTALGVVRAGFAAGKISEVFADETRPWLQGTRLTAWELMASGIPVTLQADGAAASLMASGRIGWVIVGSDRIAANGDVCNKIGTYGLAVLARHHGVRFMVAAPTSTIDLAVLNGDQIPIEERTADELLACGGQRQGPEGLAVRNPVFDVTPAHLVDAIVTEQGVVLEPDHTKIEALMQQDPT